MDEETIVLPVKMATTSEADVKIALWSALIGVAVGLTSFVFGEIVLLKTVKGANMLLVEAFEIKVKPDATE